MQQKLCNSRRVDKQRRIGYFNCRIW